MKVLVKRGPKSWLLYWRPLKAKTWYPVNYANIAFVGFIEQIRRKINMLLAGKIHEVEFEAFYSKTAKVLALWS
jgi:hypothetical protein